VESKKTPKRGEKLKYDNPLDEIKHKIKVKLELYSKENAFLREQLKAALEENESLKLQIEGNGK